MNDWQNWIVAGIVLVAAAYVLREAWLVCVAKTRAGGSCGGCTGCSPKSPQVVTLRVGGEKDDS